ncbi:MAG: hypothetical protein PHE73_09120 [Sulfurovaceae bacterium]|nr:hypothetical protein [Sulfurovaceae bacterium]
MMNIEKDIKEEVKKAENKFPEYNSYHEGFAILYEEVDELWDNVKGKGISIQEHYDEAKQIACTAIRYMKMCKRMYEKK